MFKVTVEEVFRDTDTPATVKRFEQTVDQIDMKRVIDAINHKPRAPRVRKAKEQ